MEKDAEAEEDVEEEDVEKDAEERRREGGCVDIIQRRRLTF